MNWSGTAPTVSGEPLLAEYVRRLELGRDFLPMVEKLLSSMVPPRAVTSISTRIKSWTNIVAKSERNSAPELPQDVLGVRIVVGETPDVERVKKGIAAEFEILTDQNSSRKQRYWAVVELNERRSSLPEWVRFRDVCFELQIVTRRAAVLADYLHDVLYKSGLAALPQFGIPRIDSVASKNILGAAERIVDEFEVLIGDPSAHEKRDVHPYLFANQFILHTAFDELWSEFSIGLGTEMRADFIIREATGDYVLVELENPQQQLFQARGDISAAVNHAQQQVEDWQEWIEENIQTVQRYLPGISSPKGLIIIGRSRGLTEAQQRKLRRRNVNLRGRIQIQTYDDLVSSARAFLKTVRHIL